MKREAVSLEAGFCVQVSSVGGAVRNDALDEELVATL